jgi:hypothetical protein
MYNYIDPRPAEQEEIVGNPVRKAQQAVWAISGEKVPPA